MVSLNTYQFILNPDPGCSLVAFFDSYKSETSELYFPFLIFAGVSAVYCP